MFVVYYPDLKGIIDLWRKFLMNRKIVFLVLFLIAFAVLTVLMCINIVDKVTYRLEQKDSIIQSLNNLINELKFRLFKQQNPWSPLIAPNINA